MAYKDPEKRREYQPSTASATGRSYENPRVLKGDRSWDGGRLIVMNTGR